MGKQFLLAIFGADLPLQLIAWSPGGQQIPKRLVTAGADIFAAQPYLSKLDGMEVYTMHM